MHVLETLQDVFLLDGVQRPRHVSLDVQRNIVKSAFPFKASLSRGNRKKGLYCLGANVIDMADTAVPTPLMTTHVSSVKVIKVRLLGFNPHPPHSPT
ncbi:hypothetical protein TNCV_1671161 [Trichonephila clavipes]|nr:hypothetical protein TNCV_1671161 [Trichonephila clavipes]